MAIMTYLLAQVGNGLLDTNHVHLLGVAHNGCHQALSGGNGDTDVDVVPEDDGVAAVRTLDRGVDGGDLLGGQAGGAREGAHETELDAGLLEDLVLVELPELHYGGHVNLVEGGQGGGGVLGLLEALGDSEPHAVHLDALLSTLAEGGGLLGLGRLRRGGGLFLLGGGSRLALLFGLRF